MNQQRNFVVGAIIGIAAILFGLLVLASFAVGNQGSQVAFSSTSHAISATNSFVGTAISATSVAKQNATGDYYNTDQVSSEIAYAQNPQSPAQQDTQNRIVLKNATMSITVKDPASTISAIGKIVDDQGGW